MNQIVKGKLLSFLLICSSLTGYLEWGGGNQMFLLQAEALILQKLFTGPDGIIHPFVLLPLFGQLLLVYTLFHKQAGNALLLIGMGCIAILLLFMAIIALLSLNYKILLSTLPFIITGLVTFRHLKKM